MGRPEGQNSSGPTAARLAGSRAMSKQHPEQTQPHPIQGQPEGQPGKQPAGELLPDVYAELRRLAAVLSGRLRPGQTLQPTALVHEAYLRLVRDKDPGWEGRRHFFAAAAQAMREI